MCASARAHTYTHRDTRTRKCIHTHTYTHRYIHVSQIHTHTHTLSLSLSLSLSLCLSADPMVSRGEGGDMSLYTPINVHIPGLDQLPELWQDKALSPRVFCLTERERVCVCVREGESVGCRV